MRRWPSPFKAYSHSTYRCPWLYTFHWSVPPLHFPFPYDEIAELNAYGTRAWPHGKVALRLEWAPKLEWTVLVRVLHFWWILSSLLARSCMIRFAPVANFEKSTDVPPVAFHTPRTGSRFSFAATASEAACYTLMGSTSFRIRPTLPNDEWWLLAAIWRIGKSWRQPLRMTTSVVVTCLRLFMTPWEIPKHFWGTIL